LFAIHCGYTCVSDLFAHPTRTQSPDVFVKSKYKPGSARLEISTHPGASGIDVARRRRLGRDDGRRDRCCRRRDVSLCKKGCLRATMDRARRDIVTRSGCLSCRVTRGGATSSRDQGKSLLVGMSRSSRDASIRHAAARRDAPSLGELFLLSRDKEVRRWTSLRSRYVSACRASSDDDGRRGLATKGVITRRERLI